MADCLPGIQPKNLPELDIMMSFNSVTWIPSQFLIEAIKCSVNSHAVTTKTHLDGFKIKPAHFSACLKIEALQTKLFKHFKAEPKSSAQTRVTEHLGPSDNQRKRSRNGFTPNTKSMELRGLPVMTPHNTWNKYDPSPAPEEYAYILV